MKTGLKDKLLRVLLVATGLFIVLIPVSMFLGWNLITCVLYWFIAVPVMSFVLPTLIRPHGSHLIESLLGLTVFYAFMGFMIYKHFTSDFFTLMMVSFVFNLIVIALLSLIKNQKVIANQ